MLQSSRNSHRKLDNKKFHKITISSRLILPGSMLNVYQEKVNFKMEFTIIMEICLNPLLNQQVKFFILFFLGKHLKDNNSKIYLIYSDLNKILELEKKSIEQLCQQNSLLICDLKERPLTVNLQKPSPLNQFKQKSKIQLF